MSNLFAYVDVLLKKQKLDETPEEFEKGFNPWIINRLLSCEQSLALVANAANQQGMTKQMVFDLYFYGLPKMNKWIKYNAKREKAEKELKYIMDWFHCSLQVAKMYQELISKEELQKIIDHNEKRGRK